jgi:hypothetical protein
MNIRSSFVAVVATISLLYTAPANAALVGVTSLSDLGTVDTFDWGQLGTAYTVLNGSQNVTSTGGATGTVSSEGDTFEIREQGDGWSGNFTAPDALLWTQNVGPDITFSLANPVSGIGAQIQANTFGAFTAQITAYNLIGDILGVFSRDGNSTSNGDGSAIFIGFKDTNSEIAKLRFELTQVVGSINDFAIGSIYTSNVSAVPLPTSVLLFGTAILALAALNLRRRNGFAVA